MVNIGSTSTGGRVMSVKGDLAKILLTAPACTEIGEKVALSRRIDKHWVCLNCIIVYGDRQLMTVDFIHLFFLNSGSWVRISSLLPPVKHSLVLVCLYVLVFTGWGSVRRGTVLDVENQ